MIYGCDETRRYVDAWVDGELDPSAALLVDSHLGRCDACRAEAEMIQSVKRSLASLREEDLAPSSLRVRLAMMLDAEDRADEMASTSSQKRKHAAGFMLAGAALAGFVLGTGRHDTAGSAAAQTAALGLGPSMLEDIASRHATDYPVEVRANQPAEVANFFRGRLDVPVRPVWFRGVPVTFVGARFSNVRDHGAAALYYDMAGRRVTVFVFDAALVPREGAGFMRTQVGAVPVYVGHSHGYSVAFSERNGVGYAVAADLAPQDLMRVVATAEFVP